MSRAIYPTPIPTGISGWFPWSRSVMLGLERVSNTLTLGKSATKLFPKNS